MRREDDRAGGSKMLTSPQTKSASKASTKGKTTQRKLPNLTGIPDVTKQRFENLSGLSFDDVRVHYNSSKPAQLQALAYTQGNQVYVAPGQERHLPHELGHVVQQKQGRVRPTFTVGSTQISDAPQLEEEADSWNKDTPVTHSGGNEKVGRTIQMLRMLGTPDAPPAPDFLKTCSLDLQAHHIIPNTTFQHAIEALLGAYNGAIDAAVQRFDGQWNGIWLPKGSDRVDNDAYGRLGHNGPHNIYSANVEALCTTKLDGLNNILDATNAPNAAQHIRSLIMNSPARNLDGVLIQ
jgi:hypothetical protein